jgi:general stress protein 26
MRVATTNENGHIHNVPVWFVKLGERLCFRTDEASRKVTNIRETGNATGVVDIADEGYEALRGVMVEADASIEPIEDFERAAEFANRLVDQYHDGHLPDHVRERNESVSRVIVVLEPTAYQTWDFRKVFES